MSFNDDTDIPPGHSMTFKDALHIVSANMTLGIVVPSWAMSLTSRLRTYWGSISKLIGGFYLISFFRS